MSPFREKDAASDVLEPHQDRLYYFPGEPYARAYGNLDYIPVVVLTADGRAFKYAGRDLTTQAALVAVMVDQAVTDRKAGIRRGNIIAEINKNELRERTSAKITEWTLRSMASSGLAIIEENGDGTVARVGLTEEGRAAYERTRISIADDVEHPLRATLRNPKGRYSKMGRAVRRERRAGRKLHRGGSSDD
jgi:hypothetical protein